MSSARFSRFERIVEHLIEERLTHLFDARLRPAELASRLARAMQDNAQRHQGRLIVPCHYALTLHPEDHDALLALHPDLVDLLSTVIVKLAEQTNARLAQAPVVNLRSDPGFTPRQLAVEAWHAPTTKHPTKELSLPEVPEAEGATSLRNPQLIIQGSHYVPLTRPVINIGRRRDNHIVIESPNVSRTHAQLRLRHGHYVLHDLGSTAGTLVNERAVTEVVLKPGDVIAMGGVLLVYVEDDGTTSRAATRLDDTQPMPNEGE
jgi:pSer/pThr/pTyr-binding forkhead associated (FHA) protein